jgi:hypothetical protein
MKKILALTVLFILSKSCASVASKLGTSFTLFFKTTVYASRAYAINSYTGIICQGVER